MLIETERLILRTFTEDDAADVLEYLREPAVHCFASMRLDSLDAARDEMKKRIQYIYENGGDAGWTIMVLEAEDIESLLNRAEYAEEIQEADRAALKSLKKTVKEIRSLKKSLEQRSDPWRPERCSCRDASKILNDPFV